MRPKPHHIRSYGVLACLVIVAVASYIGNQSLPLAVAEVTGLLFFWCLFYEEEDE
jgi:hypothetical protein